MPSEKSIVDAIQKYLRNHGAWVYKTHGSQFGRAGVPDLIVCMEGRFFAFEVKNENGRASDLQLREIRLIQNASGVAHVVRSVDEVRAILRAEGIQRV